MSISHISELDLNLLFPLSVLLKERHISRAAERCNVSQPAMSRSLERLRRDFNDELLVRNGRTYARTPLGDRLLGDLDKVIPEIEALYQREDQSLLASVEVIKMTMTDHACAVLLPPILRRLRTTVPLLRVEIRPFSDQRFDEVLSGQTDLLFDVAGAPRFLETETLYTDDFVCIVSKDHPITSDAFSLDDYLMYPHIAVSVLEGEQTLIDRPLKERGLYRRISLVLPYFTPAIFALGGTESILTVPRQLGLMLPLGSQVRCINPPQEIGPFQYQMIWHRRLSQDKVHLWLREQIRNAVGFLHSGKGGGYGS
jgi:DNA-binding transcriptional LysR family regulator